MEVHTELIHLEQQETTVVTLGEPTHLEQREAVMEVHTELIHLEQQETTVVTLGEPTHLEQ